MRKFQFQELKMTPISDLPIGWHVLDEHNHGIIETGFSFKIENKVFVYIHESAIATIKLYPDATTILKGKHAITLEMRLEFLLGNFVDKRLFDTYEKATTWATGFMERFHKYHSSLGKVKRNE